MALLNDLAVADDAANRSIEKKNRHWLIRAERAGLFSEPANFWHMSPAQVEQLVVSTRGTIAERVAAGCPTALRWERNENTKQVKREAATKVRSATVTPGASVTAQGGRLAVIACYFNPCRWKSRRRNFDRFLAAAEYQGADVWVIEATEPGQDFELPRAQFRIRMQDRLWVKECLLNIAVERLPNAYDQVAWVDCDLLFDNTEWVAQTSKLLTEYPVVQLFEEAVWLNELDIPSTEFGMPQRRPSVPAAIEKQVKTPFSFAVSHPGFAWAARREFLDTVGLFDHHILGSGDAVMAYGFFGQWKNRWMEQTSAVMRRAAMSWGRKAFAKVQGKVGYTPGLVRHLWHGTRKKRKYDDRLFFIRFTHLFDPARDLVKDEQGLWQWSERASPELRQQVSQYFADRQEDEVEVTA